MEVVTTDLENLASAPDFDTLLQNAEDYLNLADDPDFDLLLENANKILSQQEPTQKGSRKKDGKLHKKLALAAAGLGALSLGASEAPAISNIAAQVFSASRAMLTQPGSLPDYGPDTPQSSKSKLVEIATAPLMARVEKNRQEKSSQDPGWTERVDSELNKGRLNILLIGQGFEDYETYADATIVASFSPKDNAMSLISLHRDTYAPEITTYLQSKGQDTQERYEVMRSLEFGGVPLLEKIAEDTTGLSMDYYLKFKIGGVVELIDRVFGEIKIDVPASVPDDGSGYFFDFGEQSMDGKTAQYYMRGRKTSSVERRNSAQQQVMESLMNGVFTRLKQYGPRERELFLSQIKGVFTDLKKSGKIETNLNAEQLIDLVNNSLNSQLGNAATNVIQAITGEEFFKKPTITKMVFSDGDTVGKVPGDTGPRDALRAYLDPKTGQLITPSANTNLITDYYPLPRAKTRNMLLHQEVPAKTDNITATPTATPIETPKTTQTPKPTETPKPKAAPETKTIKNDIFREQLAPRIYEYVVQKRHERYASDPDFRERVNFELAEDRIDLLVAGSAIRLRDPQTGATEPDNLTDSIQLLSYHIPSNTLNVISIPRDLQSPEVLQVSGNPAESRINQALAGGVDLLKRAVENATGLPVDLYIHANSDVLKDFIDKTVGTIDITLDQEVKDDFYPTEDYGVERIYFPKGLNTLNGEEAVKVARSRHNTSDYDRSERQQKIIQAFLEKFLGSGNLIDKFSKLHSLIMADNVWYEKLKNGDIESDFDLNSLAFDVLRKQLSAIPALISGVKIAQMPSVFSTGLVSRGSLVSAGVRGDNFITKLNGRNINSANPRDYWDPSRVHIKKFLEDNVGEPPMTESVNLTIPSKEERVLYPKELTYQEVKPWLGKIRGTHDSVITESLFTKELAPYSAQKREQILNILAQAHAISLIEYYGDTEAIIGLDPGHGGSERGSFATTPEGTILNEKDLTWTLAQKIADELYTQTAGKYKVVFLRPQNPIDDDINGDGNISPLERLQKRKALLLATEEKLRPDPKDRGKNIAFVSVHFNHSADTARIGSEVIFPNEVAVPNPKVRQSSKKLAETLHYHIINSLRDVGYPVHDLSLREDPDKNDPYLVLDSPALDRDLSNR